MPPLPSPSNSQVGERALFKWVIERRRDRLRANAARRGRTANAAYLRSARSAAANVKALTFPEFLQARPRISIRSPPRSTPDLLLDLLSDFPRSSHRSPPNLPLISFPISADLTFPELPQALLLTCWRRVALPPAADYAASAGKAAGDRNAPHGQLVRAVREVLGRGVLPAAERLDVFRCD